MASIYRLLSVSFSVSSVWLSTVFLVYPVISPSFTVFPSFLVCLWLSAPHLPLSTSVRYNKDSTVRRLAGREPAEGWRRFLSLWSRASCQNRACKACAASRSHPSFLVVLCSPAPELCMSPNAKTTHITTERWEGRYLPENHRRTTGFWSVRKRRLVYFSREKLYCEHGKTVRRYKSHIIPILDIKLRLCSYKSN